MTEAQVAVTGDLLTFAVAGRHLALASSQVVEIIRPPVLTTVPHGPPSLLGVANLRGAVVPVVSLACMLNCEVGPVSAATRVIVAQGRVTVGVMVDEIHALTATSDADMVDLDALLARDFASLADGTRAVTDRRTQSLSIAAPEAGQTDLALMGFTLCGQEYALPIEKIAEVVKFSGVGAAVPLTDSAMMGVMTIRDRLMPLVSARVLLGLPMDGFDRGDAHVVVTRFGNVLVGLVVDVMTAILRVSAASIDVVPPVLTRGKRETQIDAICRLDGGKRLLSILSPTKIFDAETTAKILAEAGEADSTAAAAVQNDGGAEQFIVFQLDGADYGLPLAVVEEVVRRPDNIVALPRAPKFVAGMMNLRGKAVPVIDQRQRFAVKGSAGASTRVVVVNTGGLQAGLLVDGVSEILAVPTAELKPAPKLPSEVTHVFDRLAMIERRERMILTIDPETLLNQTQRHIVTALVKKTGTVATT